MHNRIKLRSIRYFCQSTWLLPWILFSRISESTTFLTPRNFFQNSATRRIRSRTIYSRRKKLDVAGQADSKEKVVRNFIWLYCTNGGGWAFNESVLKTELLGEWLTVGQPPFSRSVTFRATYTFCLTFWLTSAPPLKLNLTLRFHLFS